MIIFVLKNTSFGDTFWYGPWAIKLNDHNYFFLIYSWWLWLYYICSNYQHKPSCFFLTWKGIRFQIPKLSETCFTNQWWIYSSLNNENLCNSFFILDYILLEFTITYINYFLLSLQLLFSVNCTWQIFKTQLKCTVLMIPILLTWNTTRDWSCSKPKRLQNAKIITTRRDYSFIIHRMTGASCSHTGTGYMYHRSEILWI